LIILGSNIKIAFHRARKQLSSMVYGSGLTISRFVVQDEKYNYLSGRFPNDAQLLAEKTIALVKSTMS
jgi:hypothetical protein